MPEEMVADQIQVKPMIPGDKENYQDVLQTLELPESLYSLAMMLPLETFEESKFWNNFIHGQMMFALWINFFIQVTLIGYLYYITSENADEHGLCGSYDLTPMIYRLCVPIYIAYCLKDMIESTEMIYYFTTMTMKDSEVQDNGYITREEKQVGLTFKVVDEDGDVTADVLENSRKLNSISFKYKIYVYVAVLIPKFLLALGLLIIGTGFIVNTDDDENIILNALALGFILEMDEMIYEFISSAQWQECVATIPKVQILGDEKKAGFFKRFGALGKTAVLGILSYSMLVYWCPNEE